MGGVFDEAAVSSLNEWSGDLSKIVVQSNPLLAKLQERGNVQEVDGGKCIEEDLMYGENSTFQWYDGYETLKTTPSETLAAAEYDWKEANVNVVISQREEAQNSGGARKFDLLQARMENAEITLKNNIAKSLYSDGTGSDGKELGGLKLLVSDAPATGTVGGIDRASYMWWRNQKISFASDRSITGTPTPKQMKKAMSDMLLLTSVGGTRPNFIVSGADYFGLYEEYLDEMHRVTVSDKGDGGFAELEFKKIPVVYDPNCPDSHMYFLTLDYLKFRPHKDVNFKGGGEPKRPHNQNAKIYPVSFMGNLTCSNCLAQGVICA